MKTQTENKVYLPDYAIKYLCDGNASGMAADEIAIIENWLRVYLSDFRNVINYVISLNSDIADMFAKPIFGTPASCFDCSVSVMYK